MKSVLAYTNNLDNNAAQFSPHIKKLLNWFVFFLAFPSINILGNSITFYIFIAIVIKVGAFWKKPFNWKIIFQCFFIIVFLSTFLAPFGLMPRHPGFVNTFQLLIQYFYWILVAVFFAANYNLINKTEISKWIFHGIVLAIIGFYILPFSFNMGFISIETRLSRNSFVFNLICSVPIAFLYLRSKYSKSFLKAFLFIFLGSIVLTNGRSGAIIGTLQVLFITILLFPLWMKTVKLLILPFIILFIFVQTESAQVYLNAFAERVESVNPRMADLLRGQGEGDLKEDKSWLHRKLMVDKGLEIARKYPFLGIGPGNFRYFDSELDSFGQYDRLSNLSLDYYNNRSSHNSYIQILAETGYVGLIIIVLMLGIPALSFFKRLSMSKYNLEFLSLISLVGMSMHFYAITALTGAIPWLVIGLSYGVIINSNK